MPGDVTARTAEGLTKNQHYGRASDVVVGGPGVSITGITTDGNRIAILDDDTWALPA